MPNSRRAAEAKDLEYTSQFDFVNGALQGKSTGRRQAQGWNGNRRWIAFIPADQWATGSANPMGRRR